MKNYYPENVIENAFFTDIKSIHTAQLSLATQSDHVTEMSESLLNPALAAQLGIFPTDTFRAVSEQARTAADELEVSRNHLDQMKELVIGRYAGRLVTATEQFGKMGNIVASYGWLGEATGIIDYLDFDDNTDINDFRFSLLAAKRRNKFHHIYIAPFGILHDDKSYVSVTFHNGRRQFVQ